MHNVRIKRRELIEVVRKNKKEHRAEFLKAQEGYRQACIKELDQMLSDAREGRNIRRAIQLTEPQDMTQEYETVLAMLEMSVDDVVELSASEFQCYVRDQWSWSTMVKSANSTYIQDLKERLSR
jgi:uncharacterized protein (UPF0147 family)